MGTGSRRQVDDFIPAMVEDRSASVSLRSLYIVEKSVFGLLDPDCITEE